MTTLFVILNFGHCDLFDICALGFKNFGAWNFLNSRTQLDLNIRHDFYNIIMGHNNREPLWVYMGHLIFL